MLYNWKCIQTKIHSQLDLKQYGFHLIISFFILLDIITMINMFHTFCK